MNDARSPIIKLWKEGFRLFRRGFKAWVKCALAFVVVLSIINVSTFSHSMHLIEALKQHRAVGIRGWWEGGVVALASIGIEVLQFYFFTLIFLKLWPITEAKKQDGKTFACSVWNIFQASVIIFSPALIGMAFLFLEIWPVGSIPILLLGYMFSSYLGIRYSVVVPLIVGRIESPFKTSWSLTNNDVWRIAYSYILVIGPLSVINKIFSVCLEKTISTDVSIVSLAGVLSIAVIIVSVLRCGVSVALSCATYHVLYKEKQLPIQVLGA